jgi:hypothetical protein
MAINYDQLARGAHRSRYMQGLWLILFGLTRIARVVNGILRFKQTLFGRSMKIFLVDLVGGILSPPYQTSYRALLKKSGAPKSCKIGNPVVFPDNISQSGCSGATISCNTAAVWRRLEKTLEPLCASISWVEIIVTISINRWWPFVCFVCCNECCEN